MANSDLALIPIYMPSRVISGTLPELGRKTHSEESWFCFDPVPDSREVSDDNWRATVVRGGTGPFVTIQVWRGVLFVSEGRTWLRTPTFPALDARTALQHARERVLGFCVPEPGECPRRAPQAPTAPPADPGPDPMPWGAVDPAWLPADVQWFGCNRCWLVRAPGVGHPCPGCGCPEFSLLVLRDGFLDRGRVPVPEENPGPGPEAPAVPAFVTPRPSRARKKRAPGKSGPATPVQGSLF